MGIVSLFATLTPSADAAVSFLGVAAGDASSNWVTVWTRAVDSVVPANTPLTLEITTDNAFPIGRTTRIVDACTTDAARDYTCKVVASHLSPNTVYYYRFVGPASVRSIVGRVKTAPGPNTRARLHFAFSGDNDGLMRPYALASVIPEQKLDFYINLGDVIYETASNVLGNNGASYLDSPSVTLSNSSLSLNGEPVAGTNFATQAQLFADYSRKYRENFLPVNTGGQSSLQILYAAQGNYTTWDNHELGNRKYIDGGAPAGGSVGGPLGTDMPTGRGVDARDNGTGNLLNVNDVNNSLNDYMNRSTGFRTLQDVFINYQPVADRGLVHAPGDPRTDGTKKLYSAHQWGKNAIYINTDTRSYRDIRIKTANAGADDTTAPRANNLGRTYLGATQLAWLEQTLLDAQRGEGHAGGREGDDGSDGERDGDHDHGGSATWKFVSISDPIDQLGPMGGALTGTLTSVNADGGKSYRGGYRAERNELLRFIADNHITNVVFMATDDHQNRINELTYSPGGQTELQSSYVKVPYCFSIVAGPLGATGPDAITDHSFANIKAIADSIANAEAAVG